MNKAKSIDEYIRSFPKDIQEKLEQLRATIKKAAPAAEEKISYAMPTFVLNGNLVHFAAYKNNIGFYPSPSPIEVFKHDLTGYITLKGAIQFPVDRPLPLDLITRIVRFRVKENLDKAAHKKTPKT